MCFSEVILLLNKDYTVYDGCMSVYLTIVIGVFLGYFSTSVVRTSFKYL